MLKHRKIFVLLFLSTILAAWPPAPAFSAARPLCLRIAGLLGVKTGSKSYLPGLAKIISTISPRPTAKKGAFKAFIFTNSKALLRFAHTVGSAAQVDALRTQIVAVIGLENDEYTAGGHLWAYGNMSQQLMLFGALHRLAGHYYANHKLRQARLCAKAALLLNAQLSPVLGWRFVLAPVAFDTLPPALHAFSRRIPPTLLVRWQHEKDALQLNSSQQRTISELYANAVVKVSKLRKGLDNFTNVIASRFSQKTVTSADGVRASQKNSSMRTALLAALRAAHGLFAYRLVLRNALWGRQTLLKKGQRGAAAVIRDALHEWSQHKMHSAVEGMALSDRQALLRWIKEASLP